MMRPCPDEAALNDRLDGLLSDADSLRVDQHLEQCAACRGTSEELRSLARAAAGLPELLPERDLLPGIRAATDSRRGHWVWAAVAASVLLVAVMALALAGRERVPAATAAADVELEAAEREFVQAARKLQDLIEQRRSALPPAAFADVERELAALDRAIRDTHEALAAAPARSSGQTLAALYRKKLELLWTVSRLTAPRSDAS